MCPPSEKLLRDTFSIVIADNGAASSNGQFCLTPLQWQNRFIRRWRVKHVNYQTSFSGAIALRLDPLPIDAAIIDTTTVVDGYPILDLGGFIFTPTTFDQESQHPTQWWECGENYRMPSSILVYSNTDMSLGSTSMPPHPPSGTPGKLYITLEIEYSYGPNVKMQ